MVSGSGNFSRLCVHDFQFFMDMGACATAPIRAIPVEATSAGDVLLSDFGGFLGPSF
jgi:hypothetical protein